MFCTIVRYKIILPLFLLVTAWPNSAMSQTEHLERWTLDDCLAYAKEYNIALNSLRLSRLTSEQNLVQSRAAILPDLNASTSHNFTRTTLTNSGATTTNTNGTVGLSSSLILYSGGVLRKDITQKKLEVEMAELDVQEEMNNLYVQIIQAYTNILLDKETITYATDLVNSSKEQVQQMKQQFEVGTAARKDLIQLEAQLANDQFTLTNAQNTERQDKVNLKQLLQLPIGQPFDVAPNDTSFSPEAIPSLQEVFSNALNYRPEVKSSQFAIESAKIDLQKAKAGYLPIVTINGALGNSYGNNTSLGFSQFNNNIYQQVGIAASMPIFSKKVNKTNVARSAIAVQQAELDLSNTMTILSQAVESAYISARNAFSQYSASEEQLKYNEEAYRIAGEELRIGTYNTVEYVQQKNLYIQAVQSYTQAKYNALLALNIYNFYNKGHQYETNIN